MSDKAAGLKQQAIASPLAAALVGKQGPGFLRVG